MRLEKINEKYGSYAKGLLKWRWLALASFAVVMVLSMVGMSKMVKETSFDDYFIEGDPMLVKTNEFKSHFGNDYFIGVLTECDDHFTREHLETLRALSAELLDSLSYADKVTSLTDIEFMVGDEEGMTIEQIVPDVIPADGTAAMDSIRARAYSKPNVARKLVSADGRLSWIVVKLRPFPADSVWKATSTVSPDMVTGQEAHRIINKAEYASLHPRGTGMPYVSARKNDFIGQELGRLMKWSVIICLVVMLLMTWSLRGMIAPLLSVAGGLFITYGIAGATQMYVDSTVLMVPTILAFAVSIAYNIHVFSYFRGRMRVHGERHRALVESLSEIGWSMTFCGLTTIVSLLSFLVIPIRPMQCTGIICSMSVLFVLLVTLVVTPVLLSFGRDQRVSGVMTDDSDTWFSGWLVRLGDFTLRYSRWVTILFVLICVALCVGLADIQPSFDIERTMGYNVPYVKDVVDVGRSELGSLYSYDLVVEFADDDEAKQPANLHQLEQLIRHVETFPDTKRTTSILDILKDLNQTLHSGDTACYRIPDSEEEVAQLMLLYENAGGTEAEYWTDYEYKRLRLMVELSDYCSAQVEADLRDIESVAGSIFPNATITAVGNIPQYTTMMQYLVRGQMQSFVLSIIIIGIIMMIAFQSIRIGLIGLIPNMMPAVFVGGYMGWAGIPLDMMTATLLPMMLGLAVDDTIHFINHSKLEFDRSEPQFVGQTRPHYLYSVRRTFRVVGVAIVTTSIITSAVFSSFVGSTCNMCIHFGLLSIIGILSALLADLFITPILISKCKVFGR